jgi:hypothetical protein
MKMLTVAVLHVGFVFGMEEFDPEQPLKFYKDEIAQESCSISRIKHQEEKSDMDLFFETYQKISNFKFPEVRIGPEEIHTPHIIHDIQIEEESKNEIAQMVIPTQNIPPTQEESDSESESVLSQINKKTRSKHEKTKSKIDLAIEEIKKRKEHDIEDYKRVADKYGLNERSFLNRLRKLGLYETKGHEALDRAVAKVLQCIKDNEPYNLVEIGFEFKVKSASIRTRVNRLGQKITGQIKMCDKRRIQGLQLAAEEVLRCRTEETEYSVQEIAKRFRVKETSLGVKVHRLLLKESVNES